MSNAEEQEDVLLFGFCSRKATAHTVYTVYLLQVFCTVTAFARDTPEQQSLPEESKGFYAGIKVMPVGLIS